MSDIELIEDYIRLTYYLTSNRTDFVMGYRSYTHKTITFNTFIKGIEKVFPKGMGGDKIASLYWAKCIKTMTDKMNAHLNKFHLEIGDKPRAWEVKNAMGGEFRMEIFADLFPYHYNPSFIDKLYDEWYVEEVYKESKKLMKH